MIYLTAAQLLRIHSRPPAETGDTAGVRDLDLLEAAGAKPQPTLDGGERYPDVHGKAAAVMDSRVSNHPFVDGNKRGGITAAALVLQRNGLHPPRPTIRTPTVREASSSVSRVGRALQRRGCGAEVGGDASGVAADQFLNTPVVR